MDKQTQIAKLHERLKKETDKRTRSLIERQIRRLGFQMLDEKRRNGQ